MREEAQNIELLALGTPDNSLRVGARPATRPLPGNELWFEVRIEAEAHPFSGVMEETFPSSALVEWSGTLEKEPPARYVLGGWRAAELTLEVEPPEGAQQGQQLVVEVTLVRSGDDPWPLLRYLIFNVEPFSQRTRARDR